MKKLTYYLQFTAKRFVFNFCYWAVFASLIGLVNHIGKDMDWSLLELMCGFWGIVSHPMLAIAAGYFTLHGVLETDMEYSYRRYQSSLPPDDSFLPGAWGGDTAGNVMGAEMMSIHKPEMMSINPTTGLPMVAGPGSIDVGGHYWCEVQSDTTVAYTNYDTSTSYDYSGHDTFTSFGE